jgi:quercetin dioxygenase-like cupin family protein
MVNKPYYQTQQTLPNTPLFPFDLPEVIEKIKQEGNWKMGERNVISLLQGPCLKIVLIALHGQTEINFHQSGNLVTVQLIEGKMYFQTEKQSVMLKRGSLLTFHADLRHTLIAIEESVFLLTIADLHGKSFIN